MIRHLGRDGIAAMVAEHCRLAAHMATLPAREPGQVIVRFGARDADEAADRMMLETIRRTQADGTRFAGGALWRGRWMMRLSVISAPTTEADIARTCAAICSVRGSSVC